MSSHATHKRFCVMSIALIILLLLVMSISGTPSPVAAQAPATAAPTDGAPPGSIPQYGMFEAALAVTDAGKNVFDPSQLDVTVDFTAPDGTHTIISGFWIQPYQQNCTKDCAVEVLQPTGKPGWRVRFSPDKVGNWTYTVQQRDQVSAHVIGHGKFTVVPSKSPGFIRVGKNRHYFGYDNGMPYFPVGTNLGWSWSGANGTLGYQNWLKKLHADGANYARLYIDVPWFIGLEWKGPVGDYSSSQPDAWRLDTILQTAQEQGIALEIVLVWYQGFTTYSGLPVNPPSTPGRPDMSSDWSNNPYNVALGGPLTGPAQFFATDVGRSFFKRRLHYILARWGYSTTIFAWDLIDQLDRVSVTTPDSAADWLKDVSIYLRDNDPYKHLITAGLKDSSKSSLLDRAVLDFKQVRFFQKRPVEPAIDQVSGVLNALGLVLGQADRPVLLSEFSLGQWFEPTADDPTGIHLQETMWATALSGAAGGGATWWWDTYLFPQKLDMMYGPLAAFTQGIPWNTSALVPVGIALIGDAATDYTALRVAGYNGTFNTPKGPDMTFRLTPDGVVPPVVSASSYLYGIVYNKTLNQPQKYIITPPTDTTLTVNVRRVSEKAPAQLVILIDGKLAGAMALSPKSDPASLTVGISAGEHTVVLDNQGQDYLQIDSMEVEKYITPLRTLALADRQQGIFLAWLQHRDYTWENVTKGVEVKPVTASLRVDGMPPGQYRIELWDPFTGNVVGNDTATIAGNQEGSLNVNLLPITKMMAVRAIRVSGPTPAATAGATAVATKTP